MKKLFKTKVKWFRSDPTIEWTHTYLNALNKPVRCIIINTEQTITQSRPFTVLNENGVTVYLLEGRLKRIKK